MTQNDRRFAALRNIHKGRRCFVLGNGPSLRAADLDRLSHEITFAANKIYLLYPQTPWRPTYYNIEDELVARQNVNEINGVKGPLKFYRHEFKEILKDGPDVLWYRDKHDYYPFPQFSNNPVWQMFWGSSVTYINLQLAAFMGCTEIYLLGVDFSFALASTKLDSGVNVSTGEVNHFHPKYRAPGELWNQPNLDFQLKAFNCACEFAKTHGICIQNATRGGKLEAFPRVNFDALF